MLRAPSQQRKQPHFPLPRLSVVDNRGDLEAELAAAQRTVVDLPATDAFDALGFRIDRTPVGLDWLTYSGGRCWPDPGGDASLVIACENEARLLDLVGCRLSDRRVATWLGEGRLLGQPWLERAIGRGERLIVHSDPLLWLHRQSVGIVLVDWEEGPRLLRGVGRVLCDAVELADRLFHVTALQRLTIDVVVRS